MLQWLVTRPRYEICSILGLGLLVTGAGLHGHADQSVRLAGYWAIAIGGVLSVPLALVLACYLLILAAAPFLLLFALEANLRVWCQLRRIDRLDRAGASDGEYDAVFARIEHAMPSQAAIVERVRDERRPSRRWWLALLWNQATLEELALRDSDPIAPLAWQRAMKLGWWRECDLSRDEIVRLWARAIVSESPFAQVPEIEATKAWRQPG